MVWNIFNIFYRKFQVNLSEKYQISSLIIPWESHEVYSEAVARRSSVKKVFLKALQNSQENICGRVFFFNQVADLRPTTWLKKRPWHKCFPVNFAKFLRTHFLYNTYGSCFWIIKCLTVPPLLKSHVGISSSLQVHL